MKEKMETTVCKAFVSGRCEGLQCPPECPRYKPVKMTDIARFNTTHWADDYQ